MKAEFAGVSAGGLGTPLFEVTHSGRGLSVLVASHPVGNAGGVTLSSSCQCAGVSTAGTPAALSLRSVVEPTASQPQRARHRGSLPENTAGRSTAILGQTRVPKISVKTICHIKSKGVGADWQDSSTFCKIFGTLALQLP